MLAQELLLFEMSNRDDVFDVIDSNYQLARMTLKTPYTDGVVYQDLVEEVRQQAQAIFGEGTVIKVTGAAVTAADTVPLSLNSMMNSYMIALLVICLLMILMIGKCENGHAGYGAKSIANYDDCCGYGIDGLAF